MPCRRPPCSTPPRGLRPGWPRAMHVLASSRWQSGGTRSRREASPGDRNGSMVSGPNTSTAFWELMARWQVPDTEALTLIDQPPGASGKRPRFALTTDQTERLALLREIDRHASALYP